MDRFDAMQIFVTVVEVGSFTAAAQRLDRAKSAISRQIAALETHLGVQLLHRSTRRLSLTEAGREFYERALRILADLEEAELSLASEHSALRGRLRLAAPLSFGVQHLAPALNHFLLQHPELLIDLDLNDRRIDLVEEGIDLALRIGALPDSALVARPLMPISIRLCASPAYLQIHGHPKTPADLAFHAGLVYGNVPEAQQWRLLDNKGKVHNIKVPARMRANNGDVLLRAALDGLGIAALPGFLVHDSLQSGGLLSLLTDYQSPGTTAYMVYPSRHHLPQRVRVLMDFLIRHFAGTPPWDRP